MFCDVEQGRFSLPFASTRRFKRQDVCASQCRYRGSAFRGGLAGRCLEVFSTCECHIRGPQGIVELYDEDGRKSSKGAASLGAFLSFRGNEFDSDKTVIRREAYVEAIDSNSYKLRYMVEIAGLWTLSVHLPSGEHIAVSLRLNRCRRAAERLFIATEGKRQLCIRKAVQEFIITARDNFGNKLSTGGTPFVASCIGAGKLISVFDCKNGQHRVICDAEPTSSFSQLRVTLMGKDISNSPFVLSSQPQTTASASEPDRFLVELGKLKTQSAKSNALCKAYERLSASLVKEQREATKSYHSTRLQIVHTLPVKFTIEDPDPTLGAKRQDLIARHNRLTAEIEELSAKVRAAETVRREVLENLVERYDTSTKLHKEAVDAYKVVCREIGELTSSTKEHRRLADALRSGDPEAVRKVQDMHTMEDTVAAYYRGTEKAENTRQRIQLVSRQYMSSEIASNMISTTPDRPNTPAFWMMEGRFKPANKVQNV
ncbi:Filamin ABP280 repeat-containing protein, putative [Babesia ovata]|uniref:Filamin ABP280 repeat-containing protein, putative n=1 Tax=Babesia ovata TaxID=189622 RepID=A0A2H6KE92_9APIC|nr:Filamin ABP280 repeat-containing protein, putative [Babesia ovata]GBE61318.1 Filamin ABP280 repeat-containing protein, putative [Babesia ovata]